MSVRFVLALLALFAASAPVRAETPKARADKIAAQAQHEVERLKALDQDALVLKPVAIMCLTLPELEQWVVGIMARKLIDVDGCYPFQKAARVAVLDYPGPLSVHVRLVVPPDAPGEIRDMEFFTLPAQVVARSQVAPSLLLDAPVPAAH